MMKSLESRYTANIKNKNTVVDVTPDRKQAASEGDSKEGEGKHAHK